MRRSLPYDFRVETRFTLQCRVQREPYTYEQRRRESCGWMGVGWSIYERVLENFWKSNIFKVKNDLKFIFDWFLRLRGNISKSCFLLPIKWVFVGWSYKIIFIDPILLWAQIFLLRIDPLPCNSDGRRRRGVELKSSINLAKICDARSLWVSGGILCVKNRIS